MARHWIKLWTEIIDDSKMAQLTDRQFRLAILLFALAGQVDDEGHLPATVDLSWRLRINSTKLTADLAALEAAHIITPTPAGWLLINFEKRNSKAPSAAPDKVRERVTDFRKRQRNEDVTSLHPQCNDPVTSPEQSRAETDTEQSRAEQKPAPLTDIPDTAWATVRDSFHRWFGMLTETEANDLKALMVGVDGYSAVEIAEAIPIAEKRKKRSMSYIGGICARARQERSAPLPDPNAAPVTVGIHEEMSYDQRQ